MKPTTDEVLAWAREAGLLISVYRDSIAHVEAFAALAYAAGAEKMKARCASACEARYMGDNNREDMEARRCAAAIRALGNDDVPEISFGNMGENDD